MEKNATPPVHWADIAARKIIRERGPKKPYVCATGITPSGTVHIGNFREMISVELVVRALRDAGESVRFIHSWDDYDVFRRIPDNAPDPEKLEPFLRKPITDIPHPEHGSFARANEKKLEAVLPAVGINPEYLYQAKEYQKKRYAEEMRRALNKEKEIRTVLNEARTEALPADWSPVSVFCPFCRKDTTRVRNWNGEWELTVSCDSCGHEENLDLRNTGAVKLKWRIDWPMRWSVEGVDFEPAGKDHHSEGGSFDTAEKICRQIYDHPAPVSFQYDFIRIKGGGGKISSSKGRVVSLEEILEIYQPEIVRYLFAGTRPNAEFAVSFDLDVLKIYEDYDQCERLYFAPADAPSKNGKHEKKGLKNKRIYELSQVRETPSRAPLQVSFRHLGTLVQIHRGDGEKVLADLGESDPESQNRLRRRIACAWNWVRRYAPEDFRFTLQDTDPRTPGTEFTEAELSVLKAMRHLVASEMAQSEESEFHKKIYDLMHRCGSESSDFFALIYRALIGKEKGPRLTRFLYCIGVQKVLDILDRVILPAGSSSSGSPSS